MTSLSLFAEKSREPAALLASAMAVIDQGFAAGATAMFPLFSGGHDSLCACHVASQHPRFMQEVHHIDTTIGAKATREFVESVCREMGWRLVGEPTPAVWTSWAVFQPLSPGSSVVSPHLRDVLNVSSRVSAAASASDFFGLLFVATFYPLGQ